MELFENKIFTVTEINLSIKELIETAFSNVKVQGEISNLKKAPSGHIYFDLKDEDALISAVIFKNYANYIDTKLENGLLVTVSANGSVYIKQGRYQLIVTSITPHKQGDLHLKFERLKQKLKEKGYFDEARKKPIPQYPKKIGVVTSIGGAALRDILSILKSRHPNLEVIVAHASVQGENAKSEIARAISNLNKYKVDVILAGRGGGSMEDLWAFNEEIVAKAIFNSKIPIISCVGHETDFTIADFTADLRAPTPSAAAQIIVKNQKELIDVLLVTEKRLIKSLQGFYERQQFRVRTLINSPVFKNPNILWQNKYQTLDRFYENLINNFEDKLSNFTQRTNLLTGKLNTLNPHGILKRGYSIVRHKGRIITSPALVQKKDIIDIELHKGYLTADVTAKKDKI